MSNSSLQTQLHVIKRRWWILGIVTGLTWTLVVMILFFLLSGWLDLVWELSPGGRIGLILAAILCGGIFFGVVIVRVGRNGRKSSLARRIDHAMGFGGAVLTGCELEETFQNSQTMSAALAHIAVEHAAGLAKTTVPEKAVPIKSAKNAMIFLVSLVCLVGLLAVLMPDMMRTQWQRFCFPYNDIPQFSNTVIEIIDPEKSIVYGDPLDIRAVVCGEPVDAAELVLEPMSGTMETLPMFPEPDSHWRANLAKVTEKSVYHVRAYRARSTKHTIDVITVPRIENVRFRVTPPAYTRRAAYEGPLLKEGLSGLPDAKVEVWATSNRPLVRGEITVTMRSAVQDAGTDNKISMAPKAVGDSEVFGEFLITGSGKFELQLFDTNEQESRDKFSGGITLLKDERPMIRIVKPPARSLATPSVDVPVVISAEDDYGISRVQIFRSLNDSRALASELPLPDELLRRFNGQVDLPLSTYGLKPGDTIKVFARVEDNDPAGSKGVESSVVLIEIISQEDFEQMIRAKNGMELMLSRYREAQRRLEAMNAELERLQEKLEQMNPNDPASEEIKQEIKQLAERIRKEAEAIRKLAEHPLPYELDQQLAEELEKAAKLAEEAAQDMEKMLEGDKLDNQSAKNQLGEIGQKLSGVKKNFEQATMPSLELLAAVLPLKKDENRFVELVRRQRDLADRLSSLKGHDNEDDPAVKARMRELEEEQQQIQESLDTLLNDIEEHANRLPMQEELAQLREQALKFVEDVRSSGAGSAMSEARNGLAEFSGTIGYAKATEAADILEQFLSQCEGMGNCASGALGFQPGMGNSMNNTLSQLLRDMGFGPGGTGSGGMAGAGQGIGAQRGGPNVGLYGMLPGMAAFFDAQGGRNDGGQNLPGMGNASQDGMGFDTTSGYETTAEGTVSGTGEGVVPLRYRQAVGQYFQRIIDEDNKIPNRN